MLAMTQLNKSAFLLPCLLTALLSLGACGEGYEFVRYEGFPYSNQRTAGSGIALVRAAMLPEKGPVVEVEIPPVVPALPENKAATQEAEEVFSQMQRK
jgi:hypothetical protein